MTSTAGSAHSIVEVDGVWKTFGNFTALRDVSLAVSRGEALGIIGPSGSGKSTLLRCIHSLIDIDEGRILIDGQMLGYDTFGNKLLEVKPRELARRRASVGMVFQRFNLFPHKTALQNVMFAPAHTKLLSKAEARTRAGELLERMGLAEHRGVYPHSLSGGQQQRVAIARVLAMDPKVILFDEATSALDPELVGEVLDVIRRLSVEGVTMILVTHEIGFAREVCHRVAFMDHGTVIELGPAKQVIGEPKNARTAEFLSKVL